MINSHSNFLFAVDDGPKAIGDPICIAKKAATEGIGKLKLKL